jgi:hypothetical protein
VTVQDRTANTNKVQLRMSAVYPSTDNSITRADNGFRELLLHKVVASLAFLNGISVTCLPVTPPVEATENPTFQAVRRILPEGRPHHCVETDAQRERGHHSGRKPAAGQDHAQRESQIRSHDALMKISRDDKSSLLVKQRSDA